MSANNKEQLAALGELVQSTRQLIEQLVQINAPADTLYALKKQVDTINKQIAGLAQQQQRPIAHFNFELATTETALTLPYSPVSGPFNPIAPPLKPHYDTKNRSLTASVTCNRVYEGPRHLVHGAVIAAIYDQLLALLTTCSGSPSHTAYLNVQYKKPTPLHQPLQFYAWIAEQQGRKTLIRGHCVVNNETVTEAEGLFIQPGRSS